MWIYHQWGTQESPASHVHLLRVAPPPVILWHLDRVTSSSRVVTLTYHISGVPLHIPIHICSNYKGNLAKLSDIWVIKLLTNSCITLIFMFWYILELLYMCVRDGILCLMPMQVVQNLLDSMTPQLFVIIHLNMFNPLWHNSSNFIVLLASRMLDIVITDVKACSRPIYVEAPKCSWIMYVIF